MGLLGRGLFFRDFSPAVRLLLALYTALWVFVLPFLFWNRRMRQGWKERLLADELPGFADIWIQAASAGEASLAHELALALPRGTSLHLLLTSNTQQGLETVQKTQEELKRTRPEVTVLCRYFPFDKPSVMNEAMESFSPRVLVLLETELWPGLLAAAKRFDVPVVLLNARMRTRSLAGYLRLEGLLRPLGPEQILATSPAAALRFGMVFGHEKVRPMSNIKFDRVVSSASEVPPSPVLQEYLPAGSPFVILASVRQPEEKVVLCALQELRTKRPHTLTGLFPRHMHRIDCWKQYLEAEGIPFVLRSECTGSVSPGSVIVWDIFGELYQAYAFAQVAFVGGSLFPLGGQNFLEPLQYGVTTITGPCWDNFSWVGRDIVARGLLEEIEDSRTLGAALVKRVARPRSRDALRRKTLKYVAARKGGTAQAMACIAEYI